MIQIRAQVWGHIVYAMGRLIPSALSRANDIDDAVSLDAFPRWTNIKSKI